MIKKEELRLGNWILAVWDDGFDESEMFITGNSVEKGLELENANGEYNLLNGSIYFHSIFIHGI